jgi:hypothetical protein
VKEQSRVGWWAGGKKRCFPKGKKRPRSVDLDAPPEAGKKWLKLFGGRQFLCREKN